jgi:hypothetical protein
MDPVLAPGTPSQQDGGQAGENQQVDGRAESQREVLGHDQPPGIGGVESSAGIEKFRRGRGLYGAVKISGETAVPDSGEVSRKLCNCL